MTQAFQMQKSVKLELRNSILNNLSFRSDSMYGYKHLKEWLESTNGLNVVTPKLKPKIV